MPGSQPALGKCEVCGDQLLEIRPFTANAKVICPTCTSDALDDATAEAQSLRQELRES
jgi:hypothetical protein